MAAGSREKTVTKVVMKKYTKSKAPDVSSPSTACNVIDYFCSEILILPSSIKQFVNAT